MGGPEIEHLISLLARLPGMGPRSARRAALKMLQQPEARMLPLATALAEAARAVKPCSVCGNLDSRDPCSICSDP
jgi:recombination protein RecR